MEAAQLVLHALEHELRAAGGRQLAQEVALDEAVHQALSHRVRVRVPS